MKPEDTVNVPSPPVTRLCEQSLIDLPDSIVRPTYDRSTLTPGIIHIGVGNFHRAHQSWYLQQLMQTGLARDWAIVGAGVRPFDEVQRKKLAAQDYLTTLIELDPSGASAQIVGSMIDYVPVEKSNGPLIDRMSQPEIRIVTLTVTEGGYFVDPKVNAFNSEHPDIVHDAENPGTPKTAFGAMVAALRNRRARGHGPFTGLSCDNLQGNGDALRCAVVTLARLGDPDLADWIEGHCSFPNSMVDCIVPATGPKELKLVQALGIDDTVPVTHENFRQWVIEDDFCAGRPSWEDVGATITGNVHDYELMKIRILNGGHQIVAAAGELLSCDTIAACMAHSKINSLLSKIVREEIAPHVPSIPDMHAETYLGLIRRRFANTAIEDKTRRVSSNGTTYHPGFLFPSIRDGLQKGTPVQGLALVEAMWARICEGTREDGSVIEPNDLHWETLRDHAIRSKSDPKVWLGMRNIYGDLADEPMLASSFAQWLPLIWSEGLEAAIDIYLRG